MIFLAYSQYFDLVDFTLPLVDERAITRGGYLQDVDLTSRADLKRGNNKGGLISSRIWVDSKNRFSLPVVPTFFVFSTKTRVDTLKYQKFLPAAGYPPTKIQDLANSGNIIVETWSTLANFW